MGRTIGPKHTWCRLLGEKICDNAKCPALRRNYPAGMHGLERKRAKISSYGRQLREKQKVKRIYGIRERQFANYVAEAAQKTGDTSKFLLTYLESRLDNLVYRAGFAPTRAAARQLVSHGHFAVKDRRVTIPSYRVEVGSTITLRERSQSSRLFAALGEALAKKEFPRWLAVDPKTPAIKILNTPTLEQPNFDPKLIIGFYSR